jgi:hypothetical protein
MDDTKLDFRCMGVKRWRTRALDRTEWGFVVRKVKAKLNPLNAKLNTIYHLLALLGAHPILHVSRVRVKKL